jgi:zinc resistance-associated protein
MKPHLPAVMALATLIGGGGAAFAAAPDAAAPAATDAAQVSPTRPPSATPSTGADQGARQVDAAKAEAAKAAMDESARAQAQSEAADRSAYFDAHLAALHAGLVLTPEQDALWPALDKAIRGYSQMQADMRRKQHDRADMTGDEASGDQPAAEDNPMRILRVTGERLLARGQALKALADASEPLYATLTPDQKRRLPMLLHGLVPQRGPVGRMMSMLGGNEGPDHAGDGPRWDRHKAGRDMDRGERGMDDGRRGMDEGGRGMDEDGRGMDEAGRGMDHRKHGMDQSDRRMDEGGRGDRWSHRDRMDEPDQHGWQDRSGWSEGRARMGHRDWQDEGRRDDGQADRYAGGNSRDRDYEGGDD